MKDKVKTKESIGKQFSRLFVLEVYPPIKVGRGARAYCICECGNTKVVTVTSLRSGATQSCGCLNREKITRHGFAKSARTEDLRHYQIWSGIKQRCYNERNENYFRYGGRGIEVCERWRDSFENFIEDMGYRPSKTHSIDRIDNSGNYSKENCRWASKFEQAQNTRFNIKITFGSATRSLSYWCVMFGIPHATAMSRIKLQGMTPQQALTTPSLHSKVRVGEVFGHLKVVELLEYKNWKTKQKHRDILCECACGERVKIVDSVLRHKPLPTCKKCGVNLKTID